MSRELSESDIFVLLSERRRRLTLRILRESTAPLPVTELAENIGEREGVVPADEGVRSIHLTLSHAHLPRLDAADVVVHDQAQGTVYPGLHFDTLVRVLERATEQDQPWTEE